MKLRPTLATAISRQLFLDELNYGHWRQKKIDSIVFKHAAKGHYIRSVFEAHRRNQ